MNYRFFWKLFLASVVMIVEMLVGTILLVGGKYTLKLAIGVARIWGKASAFAFGMKITVIGQVKEKALYVSNHQSYTDIIVHSGTFAVRFVSKGDDAMRKALFFSRCIWADRRSFHSAVEVGTGIEQTIRQGISVMVYPEGTTSGSGMLDFKTTVFEVAIKSQIGITPVVTCYDPEVAWSRPERFFANFKRVLGLKKLDCRVYILPEMFPSDGENRRDFARRVRASMLAAQTRFNS